MGARGEDRRVNKSFHRRQNRFRGLRNRTRDAPVFSGILLPREGAKEALRLKAASLGSVRLSQKRFYDVRVREE